MSKQNDAALAQALRDNLKRRKEQARAAAPQPSHGADEEGDVPPPTHDEGRPGAWVAEDKKGI